MFANDAAAVARCRTEAVAQFRRHAREGDPARIATLVADAHDAAAFLRASIVQARMNEAGRYEMKLRPEMGEAGTGAVRLQTAGGAAADGEAVGVGGGGGGCGTGACGCKS